MGDHLWEDSLGPVVRGGERRQGVMALAVSEVLERRDRLAPHVESGESALKSSVVRPLAFDAMPLMNRVQDLRHSG